MAFEWRPDGRRRQEHREEEKKKMTWSQGPEAFVIVGQHSGCLEVLNLRVIRAQAVKDNTLK